MKGSAEQKPVEYDDFTDEEWESIVLLLGNRPSGQPRPAAELETKRRSFNAIRYKMAHQITWSQLPAKYGEPGSIYRNHHLYESYLYEKLYLRLDTVDVPPRVAKWLEEIMALKEQRAKKKKASRPSTEASRLEGRISNLEKIANKLQPLIWEKMSAEERVRNLESVLDRLNREPSN